MTENKSHSSLFFIYPAKARAAGALTAMLFSIYIVLLMLAPGLDISTGTRTICSLIAFAASAAVAKGASRRYVKSAWYSVSAAAVFLALKNSAILCFYIMPGSPVPGAASEISSALALLAITASFILFSQSADSVTRIRRHINIACIIWVTIAMLALPFECITPADKYGILSACRTLLNSHTLLFAFTTGFIFYWISIRRKDKKMKLVYILILASVTLTYVAADHLPYAINGAVSGWSPIFAELTGTAAYLALVAAAWSGLVMEDGSGPVSGPESYNLFYVSRIERIIPGIALLLIAVSVAGMTPGLRAEFFHHGAALLVLFALLLASFEWMSYRSEDSLLSILSISPVAIQITDRSMKKNYFINKSMFALYQSASVPADNLIASAAESEKRAMLEDSIARRDSLENFETGFMRADGSTFTATCRVAHAKYYSYNVILIWMIDTTERKKYEETLTRERDKAESQSYYKGNMLKKLSEKMLSGYILGHYREGPEGNVFIFSEMNAQALEILNSSGGLEGKKFRDVFPDPAEAIVNSVREVYATGISKRIEAYSHNLDKHLLMVIFKPGSNEIAILLNDITEQKKAEQLIRDNQEKAHRSEKIRDIGQMAGGIAHELNNRLMGISSYLSLLDLKLADPSLKKYTAGIHEIVKQSSDLIDSVLTFARQTNVQKENFRMHPLIESAAAEFTSSRRPNQPVTVSCSARADTIYGDSVLLYKAITAILSNAGDAVQEGGTISVSTENTDTRSDTFLAANCPDQELVFLLIKITDTGKSIEKENLPRIFDPFFTTKAVGRGQGLGLSTVYGAVQSNGGLIRVENGENAGTEFSIYLPCSG